jgi:hypothetical protein
VLYRVFHVRNTRNRVFEEKVADLYDRISGGDEDKNTIRSIIAELSKYQLRPEDPLSQFLNKASEYVETI